MSGGPCGGDALYRFEVYLTRVGTQSGSALEGFFVKKKERKKKFERRRNEQAFESSLTLT